MALSDTEKITGLHVTLFSMTRALKNSFQVTSEGRSLIFKGNYAEIRFGDKMVNTDGK